MILGNAEQWAQGSRDSPTVKSRCVASTARRGVFFINTSILHVTNPIHLTLPLRRHHQFAITPRHIAILDQPKTATDIEPMKQLYDVMASDARLCAGNYVLSGQRNRCKDNKKLMRLKSPNYGVGVEIGCDF